jgi:Raf kinase inhibitor-like YbhB/YbcL family protein
VGTTIQAMPLVGALLLVAACGQDSPARHEPDVPEVVEVSSAAFAEGEPIPTRYTCDGDEVSPPLTWSGVRGDARAVALVVDDPDAPSGTYTHWVVLDISRSTSSAAEGEVPGGGVQAENSAGDAAYAGPCPPEGIHHYRFTVAALDRPTGLAEGASLDDALAAVDDHTIARGTLTGTYSRD